MFGKSAGEKGTCGRIAGMSAIEISVRGLVEFLLRCGDLDNRTGGSTEDAMLAGSRMHRKLQDAAEGDYQPEVPLEGIWEYPGEDLSVHVQGRADGIYRGTNPGETEALWTIDEIKTTYRQLRSIREPEPVHLAQAKCYAWFYASQNHLEKICVRMTYCNLQTEGIRRFYETDTREELEAWYRDLMEQYHPWAKFAADWKKTRNESIRALEFPFPYRKGQRELAANVYRTIVHGRKLFLEAPTGTGKTVTTLFPSIKAIGEGKADRIFYLTAKTVTGAAAENAAWQMREKGLRVKSVLLTAREKVCILEKPDCNPESCPRAKGHFDRINEAIYALLTHEESFSRENIAEYAEQYQVCPFEMALDMSLFADVVIGDYNYLFDPHAYLRRFFAGGGAGKGQFLFLIDEAHNLVDRGREMYSASLAREELIQMRRKVKDLWPKLYTKIGRISREMLAIGRETSGYRILESVDRLAGLVTDADLELGGILGEERIADQSGRGGKDADRKKKRELRPELLDFYFKIDHFASIYSAMDEHYVCYAEAPGSIAGEIRGAVSGSGNRAAENQTAGSAVANGKRRAENVRVRLFCVDPGRRLRECMEKGRASILFSATMLPITYYKSLLGGTEEDYEIYAQSVFDPEKRGLYLVKDLTSRYQYRTPDTFERLADCIAGVISQRNGNYMVFFPSYAFLNQVADRFELRYGQTCTVIRQKSAMQEEERQAFLRRFDEIYDDRTLLGFCVMGGIFSEGIDLKKDSLIGVMIVGTGIPQVCTERELVKNYFDAKGENGYDYAYRFPGMNKVQQAAGRVIRTSEDVGIVVLIDDRFLTPACRRLFPAEWSNAQITDSREVGRLAEKFWNEWL